VLVFVYGTLLSGEGNHGLLARARFVGAGETAPVYELRDLGAFPALVEGGTHAVRGEFYEVDGETLAALDALEEHPTYYRRVEVRLADGVEAWGYVLGREHVQGCPIIASGAWRER
jgi:gamma-glutamylcyclotransferase (GGCT)/AIG2-like uncharacterized protein YtfP